MGKYIYDKNGDYIGEIRDEKKESGPDLEELFPGIGELFSWSSSEDRKIILWIIIETIPYVLLSKAIEDNKLKNEIEYISATLLLVIWVITFFHFKRIKRKRLNLENEAYEKEEKRKLDTKKKAAQKKFEAIEKKHNEELRKK